MKILIMFLLLCFFSDCGKAFESTRASNELNTIGTDTIPFPGGSTSVLIVRGVMDTDGEKLVRMEALMKRTYDLKQAIPYHAEGIFRVEILYENNHLQKVAFNALVAGDSDVMMHGFFELQIPVWTGIKNVRIVKKAGEKVLHEFSKHEIP
jgi:hypothetical protein